MEVEQIQGGRSRIHRGIVFLSLGWFGQVKGLGWLEGWLVQEIVRVWIWLC